ncbi:hypothetical protein [Paenibacillus alkalitolerans]|uniref:hypothetical protein n=1 Tax=Paenibacillus alkalitolerans TaxID=2799335 RepID=UPI0018F38B3C|nr:hypothetical protein [Paenibacillus alkalitolerans]
MTNTGKEVTLPKSEEPPGKSSLPISEQAPEEASFTKGILTGLPEYFSFVDRLDEYRILGLAAGKPFIYSVSEHKYDIVSETVCWNVRLSPDKQRIGYNNEDGIGIINIEDGTGRIVFSKEQSDQINQDGSMYFQWGTLPNQLLLIHQGEWDSFYYLLDLETGKYTPLQVKMDSYFLSEPIQWIDEHRILFSFRASKKKDGTMEYGSGYRSDLAVYDLRTGTTEKVTDTDDGYFVNFVSMQADTAYYQEMDPEQRRSYYSVDVTNKKSERIDIADEHNDIYVFWSPDTYLMGNVDPEIQEMNHVMNVSYVSRGTTRTIDAILFESSTPAWVRLGSHLAVSFGHAEKADDNLGYITKSQAHVFTFK